MDPLLARASAVHEPSIPALEERALETMVERLSFVGKLHDDCCKIGEKAKCELLEYREAKDIIIS
jgi:hypothetical protein